jgi:hypothetical protein
MVTARELKKQRDQIRKERERDARKADRLRLRALRENIRRAKMHGRSRRKEVVQVCRVGRKRARELAKAIRAQKRAEANAEIERMRSQSRSSCEVDKERARSRSADSLARASAALHAEQQHQGTIRRYTQKPKLKRAAAARRRAEVIAESDSEVLANIPAELVPVWEAKKRAIKATPRRTRTETFLEWAQEHPADVLVILDRQFHEDVEKMARDEAQLRREVAKPRLYKRLPDDELLRRYEAYRGAPEVPF